jgi:hypothetical protein
MCVFHGLSLRCVSGQRARVHAGSTRGNAMGGMLVVRVSVCLCMSVCLVS